MMGRLIRKRSHRARFGRLCRSKAWESILIVGVDGSGRSSTWSATGPTTVAITTTTPASNAIAAAAAESLTSATMSITAGAITTTSAETATSATVGLLDESLVNFDNLFLFALA